MRSRFGLLTAVGALALVGVLTTACTSNSLNAPPAPSDSGSGSGAAATDATGFPSSADPSSTSSVPVTAAALLRAPVPALCGQPAGQLIGGRLPGIAAGKGAVALAYLGGVRSQANMLALGDIDGDDVGDAAVVIACSNAAGAQSDQIVLYQSGPRVLTGVDMGALSGGAAAGTRAITLRGPEVVVDTLDRRTYDRSCCPSGTARVTLDWNGTTATANTSHLIGARDVTFTGILPVSLGMGDVQLRELYYASRPLSSGCLEYTATGRPTTIVNPRTGQAVSVAVPAGYQTFLGGLQVGRATLDEVLRTYAAYPVTRYISRNFGQAGNGVVVRGPDGAIGFGLGSSAVVTGRTVVTSMKVATPAFATAMEVKC